MAFSTTVVSPTTLWVPTGWSAFGGLSFAAGVDGAASIVVQTPAGWQVAGAALHWSSVAGGANPVRWRMKWALNTPGAASAPITMPYVDATPAAGFVIVNPPTGLAMFTCPATGTNQSLTLTVERLGSVDTHASACLAYGLALTRIS